MQKTIISSFQRHIYQCLYGQVNAGIKISLTSRKYKRGKPKIS
jgi:hypothetical protein